MPILSFLKRARYKTRTKERASMDSFSARLRSLRGKKAQAAFADEIGVSTRSLSRYENGESSPDAVAVAAICTVAKVNSEWLLFGRGPKNAEAPAQEDAPSSPAIPAQSAQRQEVPVIGLASCGQSGWYNPSALAIRLPMPVDYPPTPGLFAVIAVGTSMQPEGIRQGYVLFCDPTQTLQEEDAVFIETTDGAASVKTFKKRDGQWLHLQGWLPPDDDGVQKPYREELLREAVKRVACVVLVKRKA